MNLLSEFLDFISGKKLFSAKDHLLLAVSGGVDSVVLCELCHRAGFHFVIAHCNFQLRGEESERDERFVRRLGEKYGAETLIRKFDTNKYAEERKVSIQVAARVLRYAWFEEIVKRQSAIGNRQSGIGNREFAPGDSTESEVTSNTTDRRLATGDRRLAAADWILTAHHLDDNVETIVMNFFKGTGIAGLRGILSKTGKIIRPLLFAKKEELLQFAQEAHLEFVGDSSNQSEKYSRNYFRLQVLPLIEKVYPGALSNLAQNAERFQEIEMLYRQAMDNHWKKLIEKKGEELHIPVEKLRRSEPLHTIVHEIIKDFGFTTAQTTQVVQLMDSETGKFICSSTHRVLKNRNWLVISALGAEGQGVIEVGESDTAINLPIGRLLFKRMKNIPGFGPPADASSACLDAGHIQFPLLLRKWRKGDYFYPLGLQKKKKLARFFIDQKLSLNEKENIWVLEMDKKILWVIGKRIDNRFRIAEQTKEILQIKLETS